MTTIDRELLSNVTGGTTAKLMLDALASRFGGGGWISFRGRPKITAGAHVDHVSGVFKTAPWGGGAAVNRSFTGSVPHGGTWDEVKILKAR